MPVPRLGAARRKRSESLPAETGTGTRRVVRDADSSPLILLADGSEDNRVLYAEFLMFSGLRVAHAVDGEHALLKVVTLVPDLVVMDLAMPVLDGWEATRPIKGNPKTKHIPVIAVTGHALEEHLRRAREAGADAVLTKPCRPDTLLATIRQLLGAAARGSS